MSEKESRAVAVGVLKGGFGKTTTALNTARELAERNDRVLVIDLDDNGHMSLNLGFDEEYSGERWNQNHTEDVLINNVDPMNYTVEVVDGLDLFPSHEDLESVQNALKDATMGTTRLRENLLNPVLGDVYDYAVIDCPANRGKLNDNAMYGAQNIIIPLRPESGYESGLTNTVTRLISEAREYFDLNLLAVLPTDLRDRIDQETRDRALLKELSTREVIAKKVPNFAYLSEEDWTAVDDGSFEGGLPGIRHRASIDNANDEGLPLRDYDASCDQISCYGELAKIVETGEVSR
jgi:chromosome partitioning protein